MGNENWTRGETRSMEVNRSYWDHLKGVLMSLVVIGHFIQVYFEKCVWGDCLKTNLSWQKVTDRVEPPENGV